jgi:hypothetical protein
MRDRPHHGCGDGVNLCEFISAAGTLGRSPGASCP